MPGNNKSIHDFFMPSQPAPKPANVPSSTITISASQQAAKPLAATRSTIRPLAMGQAKSSASSVPDQPGSLVVSRPPDQAKTSGAPGASDQRGYTSSLSPPPASEPSLSSVPPPPASEPSPSTWAPSSASDPSSSLIEQSPSLVSPPPQKENVPLHSVSRNTSSDRVIQNSDDEDDDSDSSLEDLSAMLAAKASEVRAKQAVNGFTPSTPVAARHPTKSANFHVSPLPLLSKYKFDLKSLVSRAEDHEAAEASSKRVKAMMASKDEDGDIAMSDHEAELAKFPHGALLGSVVADRDDLEAHKVSRAIMRTEATVTEKRWNFFNTQSNTTKPQRTAFPTKAVPESWKDDLMDPKTRYQTFVSGFAEDMITIGKKLPDEIFLWMLDEACLEASDPLRTSYLRVARECKEQLHRLFYPNLARRIFQSLSGTSIATDIAQKVVPVPQLTGSYHNRDWARLLSIIQFFGHISKSLQQKARTTIISLLLRMSVDHLIFENVDLHDSVQITIRNLCRHTPDDEWETCVSDYLSMARKQLTISSVKKSVNLSLSAFSNQPYVLRS
jgi:hypothetical protein